MALDSMTKNFNVIINIPHNMSLKEFQSRLSNMCDDVFSRLGIKYAYIWHNRDLLNSGELKTLHLHIVLCTIKRTRVKTMLWNMVEWLHLENAYVDCITIDKCDSVPLSLQYLTHKNNSEKYQYKYDDIISNWDEFYLAEMYHEAPQIEITPKLLVTWILKGYTDIEIMLKIGVGRYSTYQNPSY